MDKEKNMLLAINLLGFKTWLGQVKDLVDDKELLENVREWANSPVLGDNIPTPGDLELFGERDQAFWNKVKQAEQKQKWAIRDCLNAVDEIYKAVTEIKEDTVCSEIAKETEEVVKKRFVLNKAMRQFNNFESKVVS